MDLNRFKEGHRELFIVLIVGLWGYTSLHGFLIPLVSFVFSPFEKSFAFDGAVLLFGLMIWRLEKKQFIGYLSIFSLWWILQFAKLYLEFSYLGAHWKVFSLLLVIASSGAFLVTAWNLLSKNYPERFLFFTKKEISKGEMFFASLVILIPFAMEVNYLKNYRPLLGHQEELIEMRKVWDERKILFSFLKVEKRDFAEQVVIDLDQEGFPSRSIQGKRLMIRVDEKMNLPYVRIHEYQWDREEKKFVHQRIQMISKKDLKFEITPNEKMLMALELPFESQGKWLFWRTDNDLPVGNFYWQKGHVMEEQ
jgi:hypothetical protein